MYHFCIFRRYSAGALLPAVSMFPSSCCSQQQFCAFSLSRGPSAPLYPNSQGSGCQPRRHEKRGSPSCFLVFVALSNNSAFHQTRAPCGGTFHLLIPFSPYQSIGVPSCRCQTAFFQSWPSSAAFRTFSSSTMMPNPGFSGRFSQPFSNSKPPPSVRYSKSPRPL